MANVRNLKKDVDRWVSEIITDVQLFVYLQPSKKVDEAYSIIEAAIAMRQQLYSRANRPDGKDEPKLVKQHYRSIKRDLLEQSHRLFERVSKLSAE
ncbi:MAG: hypothetical protein LBD59_08730 [Prevotellaceae bacterium]|jgi:hypothetical protein|nr:hypothetical protein [Prevotellaceae bacterium]